MYTNYKRIRQEAGFYNENELSPLTGSINSSNTSFYTDNEIVGDKVKFVSTFGLSNGQFGVSVNDVRVYYAADGTGFSQISVSSIDSATGAIVLTTVPVTGGSVCASFVSSSVDDDYIKYYQSVAESAIDNALGGVFELPLSKRVMEVDDLAAKLAAAYVLINNHGINAVDTSNDGYKLLDYVLGVSSNSGRLYSLVKQGYLIAEDGTVISGTKENGQVTGSNEYVSGYAGGQMFTIRDENWRYSQPDGIIGTTGGSVDNFWGI